MSTYEQHKNKSYCLRLSEEMKEKIRIIALQRGFKKTSKLYENIIEQYIREYEETYGEIETTMRKTQV